MAGLTWKEIEERIPRIRDDTNIYTLAIVQVRTMVCLGPNHCADESRWQREGGRGAHDPNTRRRTAGVCGI
jgi:hypothetical protein